MGVKNLPTLESYGELNEMIPNCVVKSDVQQMIFLLLLMNPSQNFPHP